MDATLRDLAQCFTQLQVLALNSCEEVTDEGLQEVVQRCPRLMELHAENTKMTDETRHDLAKCCTKLKKLNAAGCFGVTDAGLQQLVRDCPWRHNVDVHGCLEVRDEGLEVLAHFCGERKEVTLHFTCATSYGKNTAKWLRLGLGLV